MIKLAPVLAAPLCAVTVLAWSPAPADAFCGFYVAGADAELFNNATQVVMMRKGTRTVLSMQNAYKGPPTSFAMVIPVPVVLQEENVKTLPAEIFSRVDKLGAPRLVEYWEQDPCYQPEYERFDRAVAKSGSRPVPSAPTDSDLGVKIEAQFEVGEYEVVILSARDSTGLDRWLRREKYTIPKGAEPYLRPYVEGGSKFFVAKVNIEKVTFKDGMAMLSPLRFHYDSEEFSLPIRLGMMNSEGTQDLIVNILSPGQRYEVANYPNVTIPTNLDVRDEAKQRFGEFYAALFDRTLEKNPKAVVTEYSWDASTCDPCPLPALNPGELATLGGDVLDGGQAASDEKQAPSSGARRPPPPPRPTFVRNQFVLTRLHARYAKDGISEDLVFKAAAPIAGGREWRGGDGKLEEGSVPFGTNMFQARYAIRHAWTGKIECENPIRGRWGGPPSGVAGSSQPKAATDLAFVARGKTELAKVVAQDVPEIDLVAAPAVGATPTAPKGEPSADGAKKEKSKGCSLAGGGAGGFGALVIAFGLGLVWRRRRRS